MIGRTVSHYQILDELGQGRYKLSLVAGEPRRGRTRKSAALHPLLPNIV